MTRRQRLSKLTLFLALPGLLIGSGSSGCKGKKETETSQPVLQASTHVSATIPPPTNVVSVPDDKTVSPASISGKVVLKGTPPPERDITLTADCGKLRTSVLKTRFYAVGENGRLADVFVYIKDGLAGKTFDPSGEPVLLDQVDCEYTPYVIGLQTKQKLLVRNSDPLMHNVHPLPKVAGNKESNKAQMPRSKNFEYTFDNPELFLTYKCDVHPWMFAYVSVVDHPFFAMSGNDGGFSIKNVPDGKYSVEAYHRKAGRQTKEITVADGKSAPIEFSFDISSQ